MTATVTDILAGKFDHRFVETSGYLRLVFMSELNPQWTWIVLTVDGQNLYAAAPTFATDTKRLQSLIHSNVALTGIALPRDGSLRHRVGRIVHFMGTDSVVPVGQKTKDPYQVPSLDSIGNLPPTTIAKLPLHRVTGRVQAVWNQRNAIIITTGGKPCRVVFAVDKLPDCGDFIDCLGYPESDLHNLNLSDAVWRITSTNNFEIMISEKVHVTSPEELFRKNEASNQPTRLLNGQLIKLSGQVLSLPTPEINEKTFYLRADTLTLPVNIGNASGVLSDLVPGTEIEVTGICVAEIENYRSSLPFPQVNGTMIVLRTPTDIRILAQPSWWTAGRLIGVICGLLAVLLGILGWNITLSRITTRKSRALLTEQLGHVKAELKTEERTRLAVELHDSLAQSLTGVSLELDTADRLAEEDATAMRVHVKNASRSLKSCRDELRNCLWDLRNRALEEKTMDAAIRQTLAPHAAGIDLAIRFDIPRERISDNTAHAILRIIRELTLNGIRHGNAKKIRIAGSIDGDRMFFSVHDNGTGFDPAAAPGFSEGHYGLMGIQERIDEFEGEFNISSSPNKGTKATIALSIPQESSE